jgi:hypothetical protein
VWVKENPIIAHYVEASYIAGHHDRWTLSGGDRFERMYFNVVCKSLVLIQVFEKNWKRQQFGASMTCEHSLFIELDLNRMFFWI